MEEKIFEGKTLEEALKKAYEDLNVKEEDILYKKEETKGGLFKSGGIKVTVVLLSEVSDFLKKELAELLSKMDIESSFESKIRNGKIQIKMYSDRNSILIGRGGKTLESLNIILKQMIFNKIGLYPYFTLDVEDYKEKQEENLERMAKQLAKEVATTKVDLTLENMNSYERRIIHNILTNFKGVYTTSEGEEPNRHVVIKYKENEDD